jgi:hypothetical protein
MAIKVLKKMDIFEKKLNQSSPQLIQSLIINNPPKKSKNHIPDITVMPVILKSNLLKPLPSNLKYSLIIAIEQVRTSLSVPTSTKTKP